VKIVIDIGDESELKAAVRTGLDGLIQSMVREEVKEQITEAVKVEVAKKIESFDYNGTAQAYVRARVADVVALDNQWKLREIQDWVQKELRKGIDTRLEEVDLYKIVLERVNYSIKNVLIHVEVGDK
jgi:hypothetical protein